MRIIIPITVPNQKNTGNKNVVIVVMRRHSLRCWLDVTGGYDITSFSIYLLKILSSFLFRLSFFFADRSLVMINSIERVESIKGSETVLELPIFGTGSHER